MKNYLTISKYRNDVPVSTSLTLVLPPDCRLAGKFFLAKNS